MLFQLFYHHGYKAIHWWCLFGFFRGFFLFSLWTVEKRSSLCPMLATPPLLPHPLLREGGISSRVFVRSFVENNGTVSSRPFPHYASLRRLKRTEVRDLLRFRRYHFAFMEKMEQFLLFRSRALSLAGYHPICFHAPTKTNRGERPTALRRHRDTSFVYIHQPRALEESVHKTDAKIEKQFHVLMSSTCTARIKNVG